MGKLKISPEVNKIIKATVEAAVKKTVESLQTQNEEQNRIKRNYFKETEKLLYLYPALKERVKNGVNYPEGQKSKDVIKLNTGTSGRQKTVDEIYDEICASRERSFERTKARVQEIEQALNQIKADEFYAIIELHYFENAEWEEVATELHVSKPTVYRHRKRLINRLMVIIFGADAL